MKVIKSWVTGRPQGTYVASIALEIEFHGGYRFQIRGMRLVETNGKIALAMPNHKNPQGSWLDLVIPLNQETRDVLEEAAISAWHKSGPPDHLLDLVDRS